MQSDDTTLQANIQFLTKINGLLSPYELCCHGEDMSDKFFGIQNTESNMFTTGVFEDWSRERYADIGSYYYKTRPEDLPKDALKREEILRMARKFKTYLAVSPIIWLRSDTTVNKKKYSTHYFGIAPCVESITDKIITQPDHERIMIRVSRFTPDEKWFHNGVLLTSYTLIKLTNEVIHLEVQRKKETIKYQISLKMID